MLQHTKESCLNSLALAKKGYREGNSISFEGFFLIKSCLP